MLVFVQPVLDVLTHATKSFQRRSQVEGPSDLLNVFMGIPQGAFRLRQIEYLQKRHDPVNNFSGGLTSQRILNQHVMCIKILTCPTWLGGQLLSRRIIY